jgi:hypothetical protein
MTVGSRLQSAAGRRPIDMARSITMPYLVHRDGIGISTCKSAGAGP